MATDEGVGRADVEALGATRRDLGRDYEPDLLEAFADRVEQAVERRLDGAVHRAVEDDFERRREEFVLLQRHGTRQFVLALASVVACIPLALALALNDQLPGLVVVLLGIAAVNAAHATVRPTRRT